ncbi:hypothetical protein UFOVP1492_23 [uncultured Caudovirales phage]|uniref:Uncharacterized protein n=1 Tax=uncultured Caudovirales phage TaxID=2100421 RepID=A0A6J5R7L9_9CAUD|nr:hypothetical protein UFOVP1127_111 [uncultured Caudovirales phage]CAB4193540.1 hypothetical protein UFOVP1242_99 [uncultured Caudovirales phage]CAB4217344.1 hypothetical protein UFOVP1492_23 [uncultured Caudovirales phage]CAB5231292.1 hypothetical protein UFOVP1580_52 [uncultured Caudovirales phage]
MIWRIIYLKGKEVKQSLVELDFASAEAVCEYWQREFNPQTGIIFKTRLFEFVAALEYEAVADAEIAAVKLFVYSKKKSHWHFDKSPYAGLLTPTELSDMFEHKPIGAATLTASGVVVVAKRVNDTPEMYPLNDKPWRPSVEHSPATHFPQFGDGTIWQLEHEGRFWLAEMVQPFDDGIVQMSYWPVQTQEFFLTLTFEAYEKACCGEYVQAFYCHKNLWSVNIRRCVGTPAIILQGTPEQAGRDVSEWIAKKGLQSKYLFEC